ncbi:hypothetical protein BU26DRAFT_215113 [Trematosphaeria pertusa]|uniref:Uncharacterized protein n=1 Tax=Trematosphaeria pertusa TaxID=390896 RepID=A0A6A6IRL5_9PLEO|nr:uncharacterized protein BU26DRAFT_215113 [Trematosphaeria pertusa]KAF2253111.1 hypothetical protein BU26DRAFT_215113 [Trematosphaeria pertusa]
MAHAPMSHAQYSLALPLMLPMTQSTHRGSFMLIDGRPVILRGHIRCLAQGRMRPHHHLTQSALSVPSSTSRTFFPTTRQHLHIRNIIEG